jgi:hypothetical protein
MLAFTKNISLVRTDLIDHVDQFGIFPALRTEEVFKVLGVIQRSSWINQLRSGKSLLGRTASETIASVSDAVLSMDGEPC